MDKKKGIEEIKRIVAENQLTGQDLIALVKESGGLAPRKRPQATEGKTFKIETHCGIMYVTINKDDSGPCELFARIGKSGGCATSLLAAVSRIISLALRAGIDLDALVKQLKNIRCGANINENNGEQKESVSCADGIRMAIEQYRELKNKLC